MVGDNAIHEKCGAELWHRIVDRMRTHFQNEKFTDALVETIEEIGSVLGNYFPRTHGDANELPDDVIDS